MTVEDILISTRDILADQEKSRWEDSHLIRILNDGIANFTIHTSYAKSKVFIGLELGISTYDLSNYAINLDRVSYKGIPLPAKSEEELDRINPNWEDEEGEEPLYVCFENLRQGVFKIYPKVNNLAYDVITQNQSYGGLIDITIDEELFLLPEITNISFGTNKYVTVNYIDKPIAVTTLTDTINIPEIYKAAMVAFVSGMALRANQDTINRQYGTEQLAIYDSYVTKALGKEAKANNTFHNRQVEYRGFQ